MLDIGTGSGLLAMMACAAGAGGVTACECFAPVARSAAQCIADNGLEERIKLVARASTEMTQEDMYGGQRAHLLVPDARAAPVGVMMTHNNNVLSCALITTMSCSHVAMRERGRAHGRRQQARRRRRGGERDRTGRARSRTRLRAQSAQSTAAAPTRALVVTRGSCAGGCRGRAAAARRRPRGEVRPINEQSINMHIILYACIAYNIIHMHRRSTSSTTRSCWGRRSSPPSATPSSTSWRAPSVVVVLQCFAPSHYRSM